MWDQVSIEPSTFAPLIARFGDRLALHREGKSAAWSLDGCVVTVASHPDGSLAATFVDRPVPDAKSNAPVVAVYRALTVGYHLNSVGCGRMVDDLVAFFSGVREPRFVFSRIDDATR